MPNRKARLIVQVKDPIIGEEAIRRYLEPVSEKYTISLMFPEQKPTPRATIRRQLRGFHFVEDLSKVFTISFYHPEEDVAMWSSVLSQKPEFAQVFVEDFPFPASNK